MNIEEYIKSEEFLNKHFVGPIANDGKIYFEDVYTNNFWKKDSEEFEFCKKIICAPTSYVFLPSNYFNEEKKEEVYTKIISEVLKNTIQNKSEVPNIFKQYVKSLDSLIRAKRIFEYNSDFSKKERAIIRIKKKLNEIANIVDPEKKPSYVSEERLKYSLKTLNDLGVRRKTSQKSL